MSTPRFNQFARWALVALLLVVSGCGGSSGDGKQGSSSSGKKRIVFLINTPDPYWEANEAGLKQGAKDFDLEAAGYSVSQDPNDGTPEGQIAKLRQYASQPDIA